MTIAGDPREINTLGDDFDLRAVVPVDVDADECRGLHQGRRPGLVLREITEGPVRRLDAGNGVDRGLEDPAVVEGGEDRDALDPGQPAGQW